MRSRAALCCWCLRHEDTSIPLPEIKPESMKNMTNRRTWYLVCVLLLLVLFAQLLSSARLKSPTVDEPNHLTRGYVYFKTGKLRFTSTTGHPPLFNVISALPLSLLDEIGAPQDYPGWDGGFVNAYATTFIFRNPVPLQRLFFLGRLPTMFVTLCLAALVARWTSKLYGPWGGLISLVLCAFDPNLIAHGRLVTTDVGVTFFFALTVYIFWRFLRKPSLPSLAVAGIVLGLAQCVKFSAIVLWPVVGLLGLIDVLNPESKLQLPRRPEVAGRRWVSALLAFAGAMVVAVLLAGLTIWAVFGFEVRQPLGWTVAAPAPVYIEGLQATLTRVSSGSSTFLMGQRLTEGRWYYYPVAFALKTPLPSLIALLLALVSNARRRFRRDEWPLVVAAVAYAAASMRSSLSLGYRHLLPTLPFLWVYAGRLGLLLPRPAARSKSQPGSQPVEGGDVGPDLRLSGKRGWGVGVVVLLLGAWLVVGTLGVWPDYLAYFNALAGGPDGGWRYLVDSNLDWGQDLYALRAYVDEHDDVPIHVSWFGTTYPHLYDPGLRYRHLPGHFSYPYPHEADRSSYNPLHPAPGRYAISATNLQGIGLADGDVFERFRSQEPVARVGHSILVYEVAAASEQASPTCISGLELKHLDADTMAHSLGRGPGWVKWFDHNVSFVLPGTGDIAYVLPALPLGFVPEDSVPEGSVPEGSVPEGSVPDWQDVFRTHAVAVHTQAETDHQPAATVYVLDRASADALFKAISASLAATPPRWSAETRLDAETDMQPLAVPVVFDYGLELLGHWVLSGVGVGPGQTIELVTVWRATAEMPPATGDLQMFVHLLDTDGQMWSGEDRLDLEPLTWEPGDVLIQYHRLAVPPDAAPGEYWVELGLYVRGTMRRLAVHAGGEPVTDRLLLQPVQVKTP
jgi:4-amino-4-deoxy-L-arabinose transferase-like glycosyltransferase